MNYTNQGLIESVSRGLWWVFSLKVSTWPIRKPMSQMSSIFG